MIDSGRASPLYCDLTGCFISGFEVNRGTDVKRFRFANRTETELFAYPLGVFHSPHEFLYALHHTVRMKEQVRFLCPLSTLITFNNKSFSNLHFCNCQEPADWLHFAPPIEVVQHNFSSHGYCIRCMQSTFETRKNKKQHVLYHCLRMLAHRKTSRHQLYR